MESHLVVLPAAEADLERLASNVRTGVIRRMEWLRGNAPSVIHHRLRNMPRDLNGLCRIRYADYRILYWHFPQQRLIKVYRIKHRSEVYRDF